MKGRIVFTLDLVRYFWILIPLLWTAIIVDRAPASGLGAHIRRRNPKAWERLEGLRNSHLRLAVSDVQ